MSKRVLVAPLNWGLGHATRCIPVIRLLLERGHHVSIASDGDSLALLRAEFKELTSFALPSYHVQYSRNLPAWIDTVWRAPKFRRSIRQERAALDQILREQKFDIIISDNRYGCWSRNVHSVFISHQLNLPSPSGLLWVGAIINFFHKRLIRKFNSIWIPDAAGSMLSGKLTQTNLAADFVGILSRFSKPDKQHTPYKFSVVLSGPEPQRTLLEKNLLPQVIELNVPSVFIRGLVGEKMGQSEIENVKIVNHLKSDQLESIVRQSETIVSRSGYSTIMDLTVLGKKAIFVPTPGQPEQEYLAQKFMNSKTAYSVDQEKIDLGDALELGEAYTGFQVSDNEGLLQRAFEKIGL